MSTVGIQIQPETVPWCKRNVHLIIDRSVQAALQANALNPNRNADIQLLENLKNKFKINRVPYFSYFAKIYF